MKHYIGLDVSLKETHICIVDYDGQIVWQGEAITSPAAISKALAPYHNTIEVVVLETGGQSSWLQKGLSDLDLPTIIVDARRAIVLGSASKLKLVLGSASKLNILPHHPSPSANRHRPHLRLLSHRDTAYLLRLSGLINSFLRTYP